MAAAEGPKAKAASGAAAAAAAAALAKFGEKFMSLFDDEAPKKKKMGGKAVAVAVAAAAAAAEAEGGKPVKKQKRKRADADDFGAAAAGAGSKGAADMPGNGKGTKVSVSAAAAVVPVPTVVFSGDRPMLAASRSQAAASGNAVGVGRAKKLFMSDRVGLIHEVANNEVRGGVAAPGSMGMLGGGAWHQFLPNLTWHDFPYQLEPSCPEIHWQSSYLIRRMCTL